MDKQILDSIFRAYDIRGKIGSELDNEFFTNLGRAYVTYFKPKKVVVGNDMRDSSIDYKNALIEGLLSTGCDVVDLGEIATEMMYFAVGEFGDEFDGGLIVTPSHNDSRWNGCKILSRNADIVGNDSGLLQLKEIIINNSYVSNIGVRGTLEKIDIYPAFKKKILSFLTSKNRKPLKIIFDAGNGLGGKIFDYVFGDLGLEVEKMYFEPDGSFPNHPSNPAEEENVMELKKRVVLSGADFGIATDADADRVFFIDKKGRRPDGSYTGVILARYILSKGQNKRVIHDSRITWPMEEEGKKFGADVYTCKAGRSYYKKMMEKVDAVFAAETTTHFFYKDFYNLDTGMTTIAYMLNMYLEGFDLTESMDYLYERYPSSGEVNYKIENPLELLRRLENFYSTKEAKISNIDGLSVDFDDWRFNIRLSNTEDLVRLNLEAKTKEEVVKRFLEVEKIIGAVRENSPAGLTGYTLEN